MAGNVCFRSVAEAIDLRPDAYVNSHIHDKDGSFLFDDSSKQYSMYGLFHNEYKWGVNEGWQFTSARIPKAMLEENENGKLVNLQQRAANVGE